MFVDSDPVHILIIMNIMPTFLKEKEYNNNNNNNY